MKGLSVMKRTASTSISIFAVSSAITFLSAKPVIALSSFCYAAVRFGKKIYPTTFHSIVSPPR